MSTITDQVRKRIQGKGRGGLFVAKDFLGLGSRAAIDQALSRLARRGAIRRVGRGLYDCPRVSPRLGPLSPGPDAVAQAVAKRTGSRLQVSGAQAANALGLSTQVPAQLVYLTDGATRQVQVGTQKVVLRHVAPRYLIGAGTMTGTVLQALRYLGRDSIDQRVIRRIAARLSPDDARALRRDAVHAADWLRPVIAQIADTADRHGRVPASAPRARRGSPHAVAGGGGTQGKVTRLKLIKRTMYG